MNHLQETKKEYKHLRTQEIHGIYIYKKTNLIKLVFNRFQHDMVYRDFKDLTRRTASDKIFRDKYWQKSEI